MAVIAANASIGVLIDRRSLHRTGSLPDDLQLVAPIDLEPVGNDVVASLVEALDRGPLPARDGEQPAATHIRLLDRFFIPAVRDDRVVAPMFDLIADLYDELTDRKLNMRVAQLLLQEVLVDAPVDCEILDFGCGTGIAASAARLIRPDVKLLGVDVSKNMLRNAAQSGLATMEVARWRQDYPQVDGAISCFVLHYGVRTSDIVTISKSLRPGAIFAANFFGRDAQACRRVVDEFIGAGLRLEKSTEIGGSRKPNVLLVFRKLA